LKKALGSLAIGVGLATILVACASATPQTSASPPPIATQKPLRIDAKCSWAEGSSTVVGGRSNLDCDIRNVGRDVGNLTLETDYLNHNVVTVVFPDYLNCSVEKQVQIRCGRLLDGESVTMNIVARAKDAGNFSYTLSFLDTWKDGRQEIKDADGGNLGFAFSQTVVP
jgi:hypothetical protein